MGKSPSATTSVQDVPPEFKPAFTSLFNSAFGAARTASGQPGFPQNFFGGGQPPQGAQVGQQSTGQPTGGASGGQSLGFNSNPGINFNFPVGADFDDLDFSTLEGLTGPPVGSVGGGALGQQSTSVPLSSGPPIIGSAFPGPFIAPTLDIERESLAAREQAGRNLAGSGENLQGLANAQIGGAFLDPSSNPFFTQNIQASLQPAIDSFTRSVLPGFDSQALQSGAFKGSSARDFATGNLANDFGRNLLQTAAQTGFQNFLNERGIQQGSGQLLDEAARLQQLSPEILAQVGAGQREIAQRPIDEQLLQFQEQQQAPFRPLGPLASIIQGTEIGNTQVTQGPRPSPLGAGITGALGGASIGAGVGDLLGTGSLGTGLASGAGGLLGLLSGALG